MNDLRPVDLAVIDLSVYNAISLNGRDDACALDIFNFLARAWTFSRQDISEAVVAASLVRLARQRLINLKDGLASIPVRNPINRRGREMAVDYERGKLIPLLSVAS